MNGTWKHWVAEVEALLLAAVCASCGLSGVLLCAQCQADQWPAVRSAVTPAGLEVRAPYSFDGSLAACVRRAKDHGDTALLRYWVPAFAALVRSCAERAVPLPTRRASFLRRGFRMPEVLLARAGVPFTRMLASVSGGADQRGLSRAERAANAAGTMRARYRGDGQRLVLIDDVMTTGATLDEAARVLRGAGFTVTQACVLAITPRSGALSADTSEMTRDIR